MFARVDRGEKVTAAYWEEEGLPCLEVKVDVAEAGTDFFRLTASGEMCHAHVRADGISFSEQTVGVVPSKAWVQLKRRMYRRQVTPLAAMEEALRSMPRLKNFQWFVITNTGEHTGRVVRVDLDDAWTNDNPSGWRYQELIGAHGELRGRHDVETQANRELAKFLECDAAEKGRYCYSHNPDVR